MNGISVYMNHGKEHSISPVMMGLLSFTEDRHMSVTHTTDEELRLQRQVKELESVLKKIHRRAICSYDGRHPFDLGWIAATTAPYAQDPDDDEPT